MGVRDDDEVIAFAIELRGLRGDAYLYPDARDSMDADRRSRRTGGAHVPSPGEVAQGIPARQGPGSPMALYQTSTTPDPDAAELGRFNQLVSEVAQEVVDLLTEKHRGYGSGNLDRHGQFGIIVRLDDKTARLANMLKLGRATAADESVQDTWRDVIGYGILGLLLSRGKEV